MSDADLQHSPLPWCVVDKGPFEFPEIFDGNGDEPVIDEWHSPMLDDARFIVRCVNSHEALVSALEAVIETIAPVLRDGVRLADATDDPAIVWPELAVLDMCEAALAKALGH